MLNGSLDQWAVDFRVSFGHPNWCTNVLETEAGSTRHDTQKNMVSHFP